jgi:hypothetical protein
MLDVPNLILIGSTGRNAGKTTLACALIRRLNEESRTVAGLKITSVQAQGALCPRGGGGCGACALDRPFVLCQETDGGSSKDTVLLLQAGAKKVYWLRSLRSSLETAFTTFLEKDKPPLPSLPLLPQSPLPPPPSNEIIICESNSLRHVVKPAIFIMLEDRGEKKESARSVAHYADMTIKVSATFPPFSEREVDAIMSALPQFNN